MQEKGCDMGCNCGAKKKGTVNHFSTEQQAAIARERGVGVMTSAGSSNGSKTATKPS